MNPQSHLIVISWWSNCLGLACLHALAAHTRHPIHVVQVGKSAAQQTSFRRYLPSGVQELIYPANAPAEHSRVIAYVVAAAQQPGPLHEATGLWFIDHDMFWHENGEPWLQTADSRLLSSPYCLCLPANANSPSITQPAFWVSPLRWPANMSFDPIPCRPRIEALRPDLYRFNGQMQMPIKDTLAQARDILAPTGQVTYYNPADFPCHTHLGGLSLLAGPLLPAPWRGWMQATISRLNRFFTSCPSDWQAIEEPVLLQRLEEFTTNVYAR